MSIKIRIIRVFLLALFASSCVTKKKYVALQSDLNAAQQNLDNCNAEVNKNLDRIAAYQRDIDRLTAEASKDNQYKDQQIKVLNDQIADLKAQRATQVEQVGNLTVLSQEANSNIKETLSQLERKDKYIHLLQAARNKADSINLALAVNLKGVLSQGIQDQDVDIQVDKTVVYIDISDKMLYNSGSSTLTPRASEVLGKIAKIVESKPELEIMVEGYTDNMPISNSCVVDNWDLSVKRATSVVRELQRNFGVDPNRLIAAGRGEYNTLATNTTREGRAINRRTRIILLPKLNQFYDLLNPDNATVKIE